MIRTVKLIALILILSATSKAQDLSLSIKAGAANSLAAPSSATKGYAYKTTSHLSPYPTLALELSYLKRKSTTEYFIGLGIQPVFTGFGLNEKNIDLSQSYGAGLIIGDYNYQLYLGARRNFSKNLKLHQNYLSIHGGIGFNYFPLYTGEDGTQVNSSGKTFSGENLTGMEVGITRNVFGAPSIFAGIEYNIRNPRGKKILGVELTANYGLIKYFDWRVSYQLNGQTRNDYIPEKGLNVQLTLKIPLITFKNKRNIEDRTK